MDTVISDERDTRSFTERSKDRSVQEEFENELRGVQRRLRAARSDLLFVGMKLQDSDRPEVEVDDFRLVDTATQALAELQVRVRDILASIDPEVAPPGLRQRPTAQI
jgi:hypothetical protein